MRSRPPWRALALAVAARAPQKLDAERWKLACGWGQVDVTFRGLEARVAKLALDSMSRHMTVLHNARAVVVVAPPDGDGRKIFYNLPPGCLRETAGGREIDYGSCVLRVGV